MAAFPGMALLLVLASSAAGSGVPICFDLPKHDGLVRATVTVTDPRDDAWLVATVAGGVAFNTSATKGTHDSGCVSWDGLDDNWWPVPPGTYGQWRLAWRTG